MALYQRQYRVECGRRVRLNREISEKRIRGKMDEMRKDAVNGLVRAVWRSTIITACVFGIAACGPKKMVYIPQEWATPPPAASAGPAPGLKSVPAREQPAPSSAEPVLKSPPAFKESEIPATPSAPAAPSPQQKAAAEQPQYLASMHLVDQAKASLNQGKTDHAISLLEQAIQVDVYNGNAFFLLAKAWRTKGSRQKALEFARKAEILFQEDRAKLKEVYLFESGVYKELKDSGKAEAYRQKASRL